MHPYQEPLYTPRDLQLLTPKGKCYECEGYFIMGDLVRRSWVGKITGKSDIKDYQLLRIPINGGVRLEYTFYGELPRGIAIWYLSAGLYHFWLYPDACKPAKETFGEVDESGNLERLSLEELLAKI